MAESAYIFSFQGRACGIPCEIRVTRFQLTKGNFSPLAVTPDEYYGDQEIEWELWSALHNGGRLRWLERKVDDDDDAREALETSILEYWHEYDIHDHE